MIIDGFLMVNIPIGLPHEFLAKVSAVHHLKKKGVSGTAYHHVSAIGLFPVLTAQGCCCIIFFFFLEDAASFVVQSSLGKTGP